jgi:hypothetical protein
MQPFSSGFPGIFLPRLYILLNQKLESGLEFWSRHEASRRNSRKIYGVEYIVELIFYFLNSINFFGFHEEGIFLSLYERKGFLMKIFHYFFFIVEFYLLITNNTFISQFYSFKMKNSNKFCSKNSSKWHVLASLKCVLMQNSCDFYFFHIKSKYVTEYDL